MCIKPWNNAPHVIAELHNKKIKNFDIKVYHFCTGEKKVVKKEQTKMWKSHKRLGKLNLKLKDKNDVQLINKQKQNQRKKVIIKN